MSLLKYKTHVEHKQAGLKW